MTKAVVSSLYGGEMVASQPDDGQNERQQQQPADHIADMVPCHTPFSHPVVHPCLHGAVCHCQTQNNLLVRSNNGEAIMLCLLP